jgi:hypothetical protein
MDVADNHVKIKVARYPQTASILNQCMEQHVVVENEVARVLIRKQALQAFSIAAFATERSNNKINILGSELDSAIGLDDFHNFGFSEPLLI